MPLLGRHELEAAVEVLVVVPANELSDPLTRLFFGGKWPAGVIRPILSAPRDFVYTVLNGRVPLRGVNPEARLP